MDTFTRTQGPNETDKEFAYRCRTAPKLFQDGDNWSSIPATPEVYKDSEETRLRKLAMQQSLEIRQLKERIAALQQQLEDSQCAALSARGAA